MKKLYRGFVVLFFLFCVLEVPAFADQKAMDFSAPGTTVGSGSNFSLGWQFDTNQAFYVTSLGYFDQSPASPLANSIPIGIYNSSGNLLVSTTMSSSATADGWFRFADLSTPYLLPAGNNYVITATTRGNEYTYNPAGFSTASGITYDVGRYSYITNPLFNELVYPVNVYSTINGLYGPNFKVQAVPEPVSCGLFLLGGGVLAIVRRRKAI